MLLQVLKMISYLMEAHFDGALHFPGGGCQLMEMIQGEAEAGAVGTRHGAVLSDERQILHNRERVLGAHSTADHFDGPHHIPVNRSRNLQ